MVYFITTSLLSGSSGEDDLIQIIQIIQIIRSGSSGEDNLIQIIQIRSSSPDEPDRGKQAVVRL